MKKLVYIIPLLLLFFSCSEENKEDESPTKKDVVKAKFEYGYDFNEFNGNNESDVCQICKGNNSPDDMLICDSCGFNVCHYTCDNLNEIPEGDWYCLDCRGNCDNNEEDKDDGDIEESLSQEIEIGNGEKGDIIFDFILIYK